LCQGEGGKERLQNRYDRHSFFPLEETVPFIHPKEGGRMPVPQKKRIAAESALSTSEASSLPLPEQQEFQQHLRALAQSAVRTVLELVMREELDAFIGAEWGECSPKRKGYRNGTYTRDLATATGRLADLQVPRDREGQFHSQVFDRYSRYEPHIARSV
jgi:putative transposase